MASAETQAAVANASAFSSPALVGQLVFDHFEDRDRYLREQLRVPIPRRHAGPSVFFEDFQAALGLFEAPQHSLITPNPIDYLPFDRVRLILNGAFRLSGSARQGDLNDTVEKFSLDGLLQRQIYTLSGGECLRVAMAKSALEASTFNKLILAAPWGVLSQESSRFLTALLDLYTESPRSYLILSLRGDQTDDIDESIEPPRVGSVTFGLNVQDVKVPLSDAVQGDSSYARIDNFECSSMASPCLIRGENGHGKSLFCKALAGAIRCSGLAEVTGRPSRRIRLIFQDVSNQALLTSASLQWMMHRDPLAQRLASRLSSSISQYLKIPNESRNIREHSLLQTKLNMIALRIAQSPAGIILDEPDWGLSRPEALALLQAVTFMCAQEEIALLIISHRKWFDASFRSRLRVRRTELDGAEKDCVMRLELAMEDR
jgi:energy-coupling factor transporter ATP-binding protein EcfA2